MSNKKGTPQHTSSKGSTTISTRLDVDQRELIERAAELKNWSPAKLMRVAALEKAAAIVNLSEPKSFDFRELAREVAIQLTRPGYRLFDECLDSDITNDVQEVVSQTNYDHSVTTSIITDRLTRRDIDRLARALRLGGADFFELVLDCCERFDPGSRNTLEDPIDPTELTSR